MTRKANLALLDAAAEVWAIGKFYEREGDPALLRRIIARIKSVGLTETDVVERVGQRASATRSEFTAGPGGESDG